jgi:HSP20 family molecular chaperone IbpA
MSLQRYQSTNTSLHDLYKLYNPFAYPYQYTEKMLGELSNLVDQSVERSLTRYFQQADIKEPTVVDKGRYYELTSTIQGISPENIAIVYHNGLLTIHGKKQEQTSSEDGLTQTYSYREFTKTVPAPHTTKKVSAEMTGQRLTVMIPKESA